MSAASGLGSGMGGREAIAMKPRIYTGIGSRETPPEVCGFFRILAARLARSGWNLRSGGARGADQAFEDGVVAAIRDRNDIAAEIYLPWEGFNSKRPADKRSQGPMWKSRQPVPGCYAYAELTEAAFSLARSIHPNWGSLSVDGRCFHARNCQQVLGGDLDSPSSAVICWTKEGRRTGGTRTAIVLAEKHGIPVWNFGNRDWISKNFGNFSFPPTMPTVAEVISAMESLISS